MCLEDWGGKEVSETREGAGNTNTNDTVFPLLMAGVQRPQLCLSVLLADTCQVELMLSASVVC